VRCAIGTDYTGIRFGREKKAETKKDEISVADPQGEHGLE